MIFSRVNIENIIAQKKIKTSKILRGLSNP
jgi:hypothetical protein